jgi:hypothetical protein
LLILPLEGGEVIKFNSVRYHLHRVIIAFETVFHRAAESINFKDGSFVEDGVWHTFIHVLNPENVKLYLTFKYLKIAKKWDAQKIEYRHREIVDDSEAVGMNFVGLSIGSNGNEEEEVKDEEKMSKRNQQDVLKEIVE